MSRTLAGHKAALTTRIRYFDHYIGRLRTYVQDDQLRRRILMLEEERGLLVQQREQLERLNPEHPKLDGLIRTVLAGDMPDAG